MEKKNFVVFILSILRLFICDFSFGSHTHRHRHTTNEVKWIRKMSTKHDFRTFWHYFFSFFLLLDTENTTQNTFREIIFFFSNIVIFLLILVFFIKQMRHNFFYLFRKKCGTLFDKKRLSFYRVVHMKMIYILNATCLFLSFSQYSICSAVCCAAQSNIKNLMKRHLFILFLT